MLDFNLAFKLFNDLTEKMTARIWFKPYFVIISLLDAEFSAPVFCTLSVSVG